MKHKLSSKNRRSVAVVAPAKVNLILDVKRRRPDGFHELATVMHEIDLADRIVITRTGRPGIAFSMSPKMRGVPADSSNIVVKAAQEFFNSIKKPPAISIKLHKRVPTGAGLGGGSSDAASALIGLNRLMGARLSKMELSSMAARIGSDCPFFIYGGTAVCTGRGEKVRPVRYPVKLHFVVVYPGITLSTRQVYENFRPSLTKADPRGIIKLTSGKISIQEALYNSLQDSAANTVPALTDLIDLTASTKGVEAALLSGSGSSVFGVCPTEKDARKAAAALRKNATRLFKKALVFVARSF